MAHFPCKSFLDSIGRSEGEEYFAKVFGDCCCVCDCVCGWILDWVVVFKGITTIDVTGIICWLFVVDACWVFCVVVVVDVCDTFLFC